MRNFTGYFSICQRHRKPRFYLESRRLARLGFQAGGSVAVTRCGSDILVRTDDRNPTHRIQGRQTVHGFVRPVLSVEASSFLHSFSVGEEIKVEGHQSFLKITPSVRTFNIRRSLAVTRPFRVLEIFAGGGLLSGVFAMDGHYAVVAGQEIEPNFADIWETAHPDAELFLGDFRRANPSDYPQFEILAGGLPCDKFSPANRSARGVKTDACLSGDSADLFIPFMALVAERMPLGIVLEQVPDFLRSVAGQLVIDGLRRLGYHVTSFVIEPHAQWGEISDRRRLAILANLRAPFSISPPMKAFTGSLDQYLDRPDPERDKADADFIQVRVQAMKAHAEKHRAKDRTSNFGLVFCDRSSSRIGTIKKTYSNVNYGPLLNTDQGPRLLRKEELERIMQCRVDTPSSIWASQIIGQGVQGGPWKEIIHQFGSHLANPVTECL